MPRFAEGLRGALPKTINLLANHPFTMSSIPSPVELFAFMICLIFLLSAVLLILNIIRHFRRQPPIEAEFATKKELNELKRDVNTRLTSIENTLNANREQILEHLFQTNGIADARARAMHARIDEVLSAVKIIQGRCQAFHSGDAHAIR